ncbi:MAG: bifunctional demethylmenaquinone methyltransferase/2-methoxy-6-polyprenyl-1,4-benzoquinol methylase UbiE [Bacteroidota bacterium]|nr:bifunctional demethylmenaquinone methyltransferase/2-methoxy-6-polyprenyl-1,4-benzoquinol methylase UbiE [Bacteroidota bacterium]MDP4204765.1 bifunctional demethylmenaquinone methyltransferase/2-methoxy-6-polyprenyl-1,4-benzoquinol methylase UbiE [Bacteroidota bacterium]
MIKPYKESSAGKKVQVAEMFDNIAGHYDFLNHFLSMGIDRLWRRKAIRIVSSKRPEQILDVATGTGDFAIEASKIPNVKVTGVDISEKMLAVGREKIKKLSLDNRIKLSLGDSENLKFDDHSFDVITVAFGVRNFENLSIGLKEMQRVLKKDGMACILEFSRPTAFPIKQVYELYFFKILPFVGRLFSKDNSAYTYLPESVYNFPDGKDFVSLMEKCGFEQVEQKKLTFGIASIYLGIKK